MHAIITCFVVSHTKDPDLYEKIKTYDRRRTGKEGVISDITDGVEYQKHVASGFLANPNNISLSFNTDGVAVFRSSKKGELWPLYFVINELPPRIR